MTADDATVLVVDDERGFVEAHERMLRDAYDVETAHGGEEALQTVDDTIDAVVLDRKMPDVDGETVAKRIRDRGLDCRIVMLTAVDPGFDIVEMGIDDYLTKPTSEGELTECIEDVLAWADYDESFRDYFALSNKRDALVEEMPGVVESGRLDELEERIKRKAHEGLQKNREVLQTLIRSSPAAIVTLDRDGKVDIWNPGAEDLFGWSYEEVVDEDPPMFTPGALDRLADVRATLFADSVVTDEDVECVTRSGTPVDVSLSAAPLYDADGSMYGTMFVMMDVTERKQRKQRLTVLNRVLRHNIRNDLNVIIGRGNVLVEDLDGENREHMQTMIEVSQQLLGLSEKARSMETVLEDGEGADVSDRDVEQLVRQGVERARTEYPHADVSLSVTTDDTTALAGDGLPVAIWNLLENAIEHNDADDPTVAVTVGTETGTDHRWATVTVADDGPGIDSTEVEVIRRGSEEVLEHGSGLGLWIVKWTVDRSGGELAFDTGDLGGTAVTMRLRRPRD